MSSEFLHSSDLDLVARDSALPGLRYALDTGAMLGLLQQHDLLRGAGIESVSAHYVRYKPRTNCLAAIQIQSNLGLHRAYVKAHRQDNGTKLQKSEGRPVVAGELGAGRLVWGEHALEVCFFPNDNKLDALGWALDPKNLERHLRKRLGRGTEIAVRSIDTLAYKPERRHVSRVTLADGRRFSAKTCSGSAFAAMTASALKPVGGSWLRVPEVIGMHERRGLLLQHWLEGELLGDAWLEEDFDEERLRAVGQAVGEWHGQDCANLRRVSAASQMEVLTSLTEVMEFIVPSLATAMQQVMERVRAGYAWFGEELGACHGDFYAKQILLRDDSVGLIDFDEAHCADPASDLGTFLSHLEREVICDRIGAGKAVQLERELMAGYDVIRPGMDARKVCFYKAVKLWGRTPHFFRTRSPEWLALTEKTLQRVLELLRQSVPTSARPSTVVCIGSVDDPALPAAQRATRPELAEPALKEIVARSTGCGSEEAALRTIRVLRHKPGKRCLLEYVWDTASGQHMVMLGKLSRRGVDQGNAAVQEELFRNEFGLGCKDRVLIPEPIGVVTQWGMALQRKVEGECMTTLLDSPRANEFMERTAEALCKLHRSTVRCDRIHTLEDEMGILAKRLQEAAVTQVELRARILGLLQGCSELSALIPEVPQSLLHRDFYPDQVLMGGEHDYLVDLDLMAMGDAALDVGNFAAHLMEHALRFKGDVGALDGIRRHFVNAYLQRKVGVSADSVEIYTTLALARHISISLRIPSRERNTPMLLAACELRLQNHFDTV